MIARSVIESLVTTRRTDLYLTKEHSLAHCAEARLTMANQSHVQILGQGVSVWNQWRAAHPEIRPDLSGAFLTGIDLTKADLTKADLRGADLTGADMTGADTTGAIFEHP